MPFRSEKQRRYMYSQHPEIARRWARKYGSKPKKSVNEKAAETVARRRRRKRKRKKVK